MNRRSVVFFAALCLVYLVMPAAGFAAETVDDGNWWNIPYPETFPVDTVDFQLGHVGVEGNRFVDESGRTMCFFGVNISDPDKLVKQGHWNRRHFEVIREWGANVVRVPIHPIAWKERGKAGYFELLDQAVRWADDLGIYLIIEWHGIGNLKSEVFQHPMHETTQGETFAFWRAIAHRYADVPTVAFYELFNEPTLYGGQLGEMSWAEWKALVEEMIHIIRAHDQKVVALVGGFDWAYRLTEAGVDPVDLPGVAYVTHPYPMKTGEPWEKNWQRDFGFLAETYPVFATEIGFMGADDPGAHIPVIADEDYGRRMVDFLNARGMSWTAWCFDPDWAPQMIVDWDYAPTTQGLFFRDVMLKQHGVCTTPGK